MLWGGKSRIFFEIKRRRAGDIKLQEASVFTVVNFRLKNIEMYVSINRNFKIEYSFQHLMAVSIFLQNFDKGMLKSCSFHEWKEQMKMCRTVYDNNL